jgi:4-hydroxy-3-methylbut-2-en-1-yl diphosphate reductase
MKLLLLSPRGFCAGVDMAIRALDRAIELFGTPIYAYHQIVHNTHVVSSFSQRGVIFVDSLADVPDDCVLLYSAHGVAPDIRAESARKRLTVIDATCPLVLKVHNEARRFASAGATVMIVGHAGHDEVVGVIGEIPAQSVLVETVADIARVDVAAGTPVAYVTQTTLSLTDTRAILHGLRERFPSILEPPKQDICYATQNRQDAVNAAAAEADLVIVIGSENSSNTKRLVEAARQNHASAYRIDSASDLDFAWFENVATCAITSGASVPESLVQQTISIIAAHFDVEIENREVADETLHFALPAALAR